MSGASENCAVCGRRMPENSRDENKLYCSRRCQGQKSLLKNGDEEKILALLRERPGSATICPSEILPEEMKSNKPRMEEVRMAARRLVHKGMIMITQKGRPVDPSDFRGPIRLRLKS